MSEPNHEVAVKVCGVTNSDDALMCAEVGADMIGINFSPVSPRCVTSVEAGHIIFAVRARFPAIKFVGVFVNQERAFIQALVSELSLDGVQLHGAELPEDVRTITAPFVIKALSVGPDFIPDRASEYECDAILLDAWSKDAWGGTGHTFPWSKAAAVRPLVQKLILAGGLTPENVGDALRIVRPFAVDVCSGIEDAPGRKNHGKVRHFMAAVRAANKVSL